MENANKTYDLKVEKMIPKSPAEVFRAISEGRLFMNCSADQESLKIDFKVGGKYSLLFASHNMKNTGEFLEIVPNEKIVFTWCQDYDTSPIPDTKVSIDLKDVGGKTALTLVHAGFNDLDNCDGHKDGWTGGLNDLTEEMTNAKIRLTRRIHASVERLYEICKNPDGAFKGEVVEKVPNQKVVLNAGGTKLTLLIDTDDDSADASWLELNQEGFKSQSELLAQRAKWDSTLKTLK
jgi:uncharacterized protein YndB with AHSA1/START domain